MRSARKRLRLCVDTHRHETSGETDERLFSLVARREAPFFTDAERAALALTERRPASGEEGVTDEVWTEARGQYDDAELIALVTAIAATTCVEPAQRDAAIGARVAARPHRGQTAVTSTRRSEPRGPDRRGGGIR